MILRRNYRNIVKDRWEGRIICSCRWVVGRMRLLWLWWELRLRRGNGFVLKICIWLPLGWQHWKRNFKGYKTVIKISNSSLQVSSTCHSQVFCYKLALNWAMNLLRVWRKTFYVRTNQCKVVLVWKVHFRLLWHISMLWYRSEEHIFLKDGARLINFLIPI